MKIYTRRGDEGKTDLFGGERVLKNALQVKAYGEIDCANAAIGLARSLGEMSAWLQKELEKTMRLLFCAGSEVATAQKDSAQKILSKHLANRIGDAHILELEQTIDAVEEKLSPLKSFILPCGTEVSAQLHVARNAVRKAEIALIDLMESGASVRPEILRFFNRLSDYLFVLARLANHERGVEDLTWSGKLDGL